MEDQRYIAWIEVSQSQVAGLTGTARDWQQDLQEESEEV
jgi:hypothetical protein